MANLKQTGVRISQYQVAQINDNDKKNKLLLNHNFITYAPSYFGTSTMNKNYQIPVQTLRDDFKGYLGVENAKGTWQNTIRIWSGNWIDTENRENSYVYQWNYDERGNLDYIADKWGDEEDVDKIFLLRNAPIPFEEPQQDPNPKSNKFVDKKYIDDRFNGIRKISVTGETLAIRPYSCVYEFDSTPTVINIVDTETLQDGRTVAECIDGNILTFIIKFNVGDSDILAIKANGEHNIKWSYPTEFQDIVKAAKENNNSDVWLQCYVGYTEDGLSIRCSSALHPMPGSHEPPKVTDKVTDGDTKVPTSDAVHDFVKEEIKPKLEEVVAGDTFIEVKNKNEVFVNTSSTITNDGSTVPTTKAVYDSIEELIVSEEYDEIIFDLSNIFYEQINKQWCELIVTLSENEIEIPYKEKYYPNVGTLKISGITAGSNPASPSVTTTGFELESFVIDAIRRKLMNVAMTGNQDSLNNVIANYQNDIPYKAAWVRDAKALNIPTQLAFRHSSYRTNEILRMFFYYLDQENGKTWGADDSYSKKYMVTGLTYKCLTRPDTTFPTDQYYSYVYNIWLGDRGNTDRTLIAWNYEPSYLTIGSYPNESHGANWDGDSFTMPVNWDTLVNEQAWDSFITDYKNLKTNIEDNFESSNALIKNVIENKEYLFDNFDSAIHGIGNHQVYTIVFSKKHFYTGKIETITLYHDGAGDYRVQGGYLAIQVYKEANNENEVPQIFYSSNSYDYKSEDKCYKFNFENCVLDDYAKVHISMVRDTNVVPAYKPIATQCSKQEGETRSQVSLMRISCIKKNGQEGEENILDENDECGVYWDTSGNSQGLQNKLIRVSVNRISPSFIEPFNLDNIDEIQDIKDDITELFYNVNEHVSNYNEHVSDFNEHKSDTTSAVSHVTDAERTSWNNTQTKLETIKSNYESSDSCLKSIIGNGDFVFNNYNPAIHTLGNHQGDMLVFTKKHFYTGKLLNIIIPHDSGGSYVSGGYLAIQVYKELNNESEIPQIFYSENKCDYIASSGGYRFNFVNCVLDDYAKVHLTIVKDKTVIPPYKPTTVTDNTGISKIRFQVVQKNGSEGEGNILGENDGCGVYWDTSGNIVDKLAHVAINKLAVKLVENYDFSEEEEEDVNELKLIQETVSFGESNINQNSNSNCYGITFIAQENATIDTLTIKTANSAYFTKVENLYAIIHEEQEDGTKKEIASMETPVHLSSSNTQYKLTFYPFAITKDKKYFVEFIQKNTETGSFNGTRTQVNLGLINDTSASGVLSQSSRDSWNVSYANQYSPILKLSQEMFIMGNLVLPNDVQYPLSLVAKLNGEDASNIVLLKPFVTASTDINIESVTNGHVLGIILEKNENTVAGEHYLGIKTLYINKDTNEMKEILLHSPLTIIE